MVVAAFGLDGLDDYGGRRGVPFFDEALRLGEAALFFGLVFGGVLVERVLDDGEGCLWPVEGGYVQLVDGFRAGGGETTEQAAVEAGLEGEDGELGGAGGLVRHGRVDLCFGEVYIGTAALLLASVHKGSFVGKLVGVGAGLTGEDLVQALWCHREYARLQDFGPVVLGEVSEGGSVDDGRGHVWRGSCEL